ncbi:transposase [Halosquirtibacter xylanolyticus]|uniref:transposase n=1 Tax=Halosquirtibacter xylanolyticus TaxID=3374599 RepID=UPI003747DEF8|nr:transposase [Prolixibacteraceae bacterium]
MKYDIEFKEMVVSLVRSGQSVTKVAKDYKVSPITLRSWLKKAASIEGLEGKKTLTAEEQEIKRLKKALKNAELERDILKKAVSIFSKKD